MSQETTQKIERKTSINFGFGISLSEWATSALIGLGSAIWAAAGTVHSRFGDDVRNSQSISEKAKKNAIDLERIIEKTKHLPTAQRWEAVVNKKMELVTDIENYTHIDLGISKKLVQGTLDRTKSLTKHSKNAIIRNAVIGTIVGSAMALSFFNSVAIRDKLNKIDDAVEPPPAVPENNESIAKGKHAKAKHGEKTIEKTKPDHKVTDVSSEKTLEAKREHSLAS